MTRSATLSLISDVDELRVVVVEELLNVAITIEGKVMDGSEVKEETTILHSKCLVVELHPLWVGMKK